MGEGYCAGGAAPKFVEPSQPPAVSIFRIRPGVSWKLTNFGPARNPGGPAHSRRTRGNANAKKRPGRWPGA